MARPDAAQAVIWLARKAAYQLRLAIHRVLFPDKPPPPPPRGIDDVIADIRRDPLKTVLQTELPRSEVVVLFFAADLFIFASKVEYSPLVLFEACAAGLPFVSVPVGNAAEIARWTGGGVICRPAEKDERGYVRVEPATLAAEIDRLITDDTARKALGTAGRAAWSQRYSWDVISRQYIAILAKTQEKNTHTNTTQCADLMPLAHHLAIAERRSFR